MFSSFNRFSMMASIFAIVIVQLTGATASAATSELETQCMANVQGKIAWDGGSNMTWDTKNLEQLCTGTSKPEEPGKCFLAVSTGHAAGKVDWGKGTEWEWQNIINLCSGSNDGEKTVNCFKNGIKAGADWRDAILNCHRALK